jgi:hypothetical protein
MLENAGLNTTKDVTLLQLALDRDEQTRRLCVNQINCTWKDPRSPSRPFVNLDRLVQGPRIVANHRSCSFVEPAFFPGDQPYEVC